jgi:hypothetical protein
MIFRLMKAPSFNILPGAMKQYVCIPLLILALSTQVYSQLKVSENGRHLVDEEGNPFFWLGDTGWALFQKLAREEVALYFKTRAQQGFSVIHAAVYNKNPFVLSPLSNVYGDLPFINDDLLRPFITPGSNTNDSLAYDYWDHVEFVINTADQYGLYINLLPIFGISEGEGYNLITTENACEYGRFIGNRYKDNKNIIWCMGGDVLADNELRRSVWDLLAKGITESVAGSEDYNKTLMTYHVRGGHSSSEYFANAPWLDFHMLQTWASFTKIYDAVTKDYIREPIKPTLHGEGAYEDGPEYPTKPITTHIIRKQVYWANFAGGFHTYGNSNVWNFGTNPYYVSQDWIDALRSEGAGNLSVFRTIFGSLEWWNLIPDQSIIINGIGGGDSLNVAMRSSGNDTMIVYCSESSLTIDLKIFDVDESIVADWIDPKTGKRNNIGIFSNISTKTLSTPEGWEDALLLLQVEK